MLNNYYEQLRKLMELLGHGQNMDFDIYLQTIVLTAKIILEALGGIFLAAVLIAGPLMAYKRTMKKFNVQLEKYSTEKEKVEVDVILRKVKAFKITFALGTIFIYIPFVIPTVLLFM